MNALEEQFVTEARELVQQAIQDLIVLEREGFSAEHTDRVFRTFHTLKGSAGMVELPEMALTLHAAEDVLSAVRTGALPLSTPVIDGALGCLDQVSDWVEAFAADGRLPPRAGEHAAAMTNSLRVLLPGESETKVLRSPSPEAGAASPASMPDWVGDLIDAAGEGITEVSGRDIVAICYEPRADCFFSGDDPLQTVRKLPNLLALRMEPVRPWPPPGELDPYSCNLRFLALVAAPRSDIAPLFRLVPDQVRIIDVPDSAMRRTSGPEERASGIVLAILNEQRDMLKTTLPGEGFAGRVGSARRSATNALRHERQIALAEEIEHAGLLSITSGVAAPLLAALEKVLKQLTPGALGKSAIDIPALKSGPGETERVASELLRVEESKVNALGNVAGELMVLKNAFAHLAKRIETEFPGHDIARTARRETDAMDRLAAELHASVLQLRMVPVGQVFRSFPRLVRDMAQRLGKKVTLAVEGETTDADKRIVDRLFEPLLHLVRNAVDHGIELPGARKTSGKPETAVLTLRATPAGRRILIEVADDGGGIDPVIIRRRAAERGLLKPEELAELTDDRVIDLIFSAGFSTAAQISDISGRGVGMDAVRSAVQQMDGRVSVASLVGKGTVVTLDIPSDIALTRVMVVEAGGQVFGISLDAVTETLRLPPDRITQVKDNAGFVLRDRVVPILPLAELMKLPGESVADDQARLVVVVEHAGQMAALQVSAIRDRLEAVLKPMQGLLAGASGYAGTTLLGDGRVLLVLDLKEILR